MSLQNFMEIQHEEHWYFKSIDRSTELEFNLGIIILEILETHNLIQFEIQKISSENTTRIVRIQN